MTQTRFTLTMEKSVQVCCDSNHQYDKVCNLFELNISTNTANIVSRRQIKTDVKWFERNSYKS